MLTDSMWSYEHDYEQGNEGIYMYVQVCNISWWPSAASPPPLKLWQQKQLPQDPNECSLNYIKCSVRYLLKYLKTCPSQASQN